ncbi:hypothetical protein [Anaerosinus massiliensis]|uniref:hypothetical protein n=1 Tax=Massilibacillus massiliensis TaxID=1806837 RepID=UPI000A514C4B|nr:hypothetical protein [Massilibacillus massiliensis]
MSDIYMQIYRSAAGMVIAEETVVFDTILSSNGNISYDTATGVITFNEIGRYIMTWSVVTQTAGTTSGPRFALSSSQADFIEGNSPIKTGEVTGNGIIDITVPPVSVSLVNTSLANVFYSSLVPIKASLSVISSGFNDGMEYTSICFGNAQLANVIEQLIVLYPASTMSIYTTNLSVVTGTPSQLYTSPAADGAGLFILLNGSSQFEVIPIMSIAAIYTGDGTVYEDSITYLAPPVPLPKGCDTNMMTAIRDYLTIGTEAAINIGPAYQAAGDIYRNEYGIIVLSEVATGSMPLFIPTSHMSRIIIDQSSGVQGTSVKPTIKPL